MLDPLILALIVVTVIAVIGCYLFFRKTRSQDQEIRNMRSQYASLFQDMQNGSQQLIMSAGEARSGTRHHVLASMFEITDRQVDELVTRVMRHVMSESERTVAGIASTIDPGGGNNGSSSGGSTRSPQPLPPSPSPSAPPRTASAQSARPPAAVQDLFRPAPGNTTHSSAGDDPEVYIKAIEAISQLYHKRTQQGGDEKRPMTS